MTFKVKWKGGSSVKPFTVKFEPNKLVDALQSIKRASQNCELDLTVDFSPELSVGEAQGVAQALGAIDSPKIKVNGFLPGQFFYQAFLPQESWRDRNSRLDQPLEVHLGDPDKLIVIDEDWSGSGVDPKLIISEKSLDAAANITNRVTCLIYAAKTDKLGRVFKIAEKLHKSIYNFYVYGD